MMHKAKGQPINRVIDSLGQSSDNALEMQQFHDSWFGEESEHESLYGSPDVWAPIKRSGHFRRMEILAQTDLGSLADKVVADFGVGPWGFSCVFPKLRKAARCIGFDVSAKALQITADLDIDIAGSTEYFTSDGETIPIADDSVDIFWAGEVIEHVRDPQRFLQEICRVCRDDARVFLSTPNRDAIYYLSRREDYAIGPEHIALMNLDELTSLLDLFFSTYNIVGYETSLSPELDPVVTDEAILDIIQERAYVHPRSASGFIVEARVDKALLAANRLNWAMHETLWSDAVVPNAEAAERLVLFENVAGGAIVSGQSFRFSVSGDRLILLFWSHDWSGGTRITVDGTEYSKDLYSPAGGFKRFALTDLAPGNHDIEITANGSRNPKSQSDQVIFYKAISYETH